MNDNDTTLTINDPVSQMFSYQIESKSILYWYTAVAYDNNITHTTDNTYADDD